jgi:hypothetical protein
MDKRVMQIILAISLVVYLLVPAFAVENNWLTGWANRIKLVIDHSKIDSTLSDFPVLVHLSKSSGQLSDDVSFIFDEIEDSDRNKIAFTTADGTSQCYAEIEEWNQVKREAWIWVRVPSISGSEDAILFLYYDKTAVDNTSYIGDTGSEVSKKVWDDKFAMVQHLGDNGQTDGGEFIDSTAYAHNGIGGGGNANKTPISTDAKIGKGQIFDGVKDYLEVPDCDEFSISTYGGLTVSFWMSPSVTDFSNSDDYIHFLGKGDTGKFEWSFVMYNKDGTDNRSQRISFYMFNVGGGLGAGHYTQQPVEVNEWVYITGKVDNNYIYMYRNGEYINRSDYTVAKGEIPKIIPENGDAPVRIGTRNLENKDWWNGRLDEVRISDAPRSTAWIKASYYAESDKLIDFEVPRNQMPVLNPIGDRSVKAGELLSFTVLADDPDGDALTYSVSNLPTGAQFDAAKATFSWKPDYNQVGTYSGIRFQVSDGSLSDSQEITIVVNQGAKESAPHRLNPVIYVTAIIVPVAMAILLIYFWYKRRNKK